MKKPTIKVTVTVFIMTVFLLTNGLAVAKTKTTKPIEHFDFFKEYADKVLEECLRENPKSIHDVRVIARQWKLQWAWTVARLTINPKEIPGVATFLVNQKIIYNLCNELGLAGKLWSEIKVALRVIESLKKDPKSPVDEAATKMVRATQTTGYRIFVNSVFDPEILDQTETGLNIILEEVVEHINKKPPPFD